MGAAAILFFFQVAGDTVVRDLGLPVPGAVVGIVLLILALAGEVARPRP